MYVTNPQNGVVLPEVFFIRLATFQTVSPFAKGSVLLFSRWGSRWGPKMNKSWPLNWNEMEVVFICFKVVAKTSYISFIIFCCTWVSCPFMLSGLPEGAMCCFSRGVQIESYVFLIEKKNWFGADKTTRRFFISRHLRNRWGSELVVFSYQFKSELSHLTLTTIKLPP